jgi:hypothetical protein
MNTLFNRINKTSSSPPQKNPKDILKEMSKYLSLPDIEYYSIPLIPLYDSELHKLAVNSMRKDKRVPLNQEDIPPNVLDRILSERPYLNIQRNGMSEEEIQDLLNNL